MILDLIVVYLMEIIAWGGVNIYRVSVGIRRVTTRRDNYYKCMQYLYTYLCKKPQVSLSKSNMAYSQEGNKVESTKVMIILA